MMKDYNSPSGRAFSSVIAFSVLLACGVLGYFLWQPSLAPSEVAGDHQPGASTLPAADETVGTAAKAIQPGKPAGSAEKVAREPPPARVTRPESAEAEALPELGSSFPVRVDFERIDIRQYQANYPDVHMGWMPSRAEQAEEARRWGSYLGPLGVRVCSHVPQLQNRAAFAAIVPKAIQTEDGKLGICAAEVMDVAPGSPADGHLEAGDLIVGIEGEMLRSGNDYRPGWEFMHKDSRELQLMLGEKIDQAQGRGDIRLSVLRLPADKVRPLPVKQSELWVGEGGNQSLGAQEFSVDIPGGGLLTLESGKFDESIAGDGAMWMDLVLEGDYGEKRLLKLPALTLAPGYGRAEVKTDQVWEYKGKSFRDTLNLHARGIAQWKIPAGTKRLKGSFAAMSYGKVRPHVLHRPSALPLQGAHREHLVELRFPIGKAGSFSDSYPKDCDKTELTVARHTDWLAAQQREDGSWPRLRGYTGDGWDTSWCALALMSSGDPKYDGQVRKAAYRVAYDTAPSGWTAERSMRLIFLSEYYLKYRDPGIVAGIQAAYYQVLDCCKTDHMAGHKVNGFGYGIAGQHYGTGHLALAIAVASRTPISRNEKLVADIIRHAGEVCVNGTYAYGRGRRMRRDESRRHGGGNAMSGPAVLGIQIAGGHTSAVREHTERIAASIGDGDNSHATSSLAFIFSSLAVAAADEEVFLRHMANFRYKMTLDDNWEGGILKSAFPLDYQGGEGVTSNWIRTAGSILVLNALKHELAITGKREHWKPQGLEEVPVSEWGGQVHSYYLRNWCLVSELLGSRAPAALKEGIRRLHGLPRDMDLVPATRRIVLAGAPRMIQAIATDKSLGERRRAYAIELLCGLDFRIFTSSEGATQKVDLHVNLPLQQLNWLDENKAELFEASPFPLEATVELAGQALAEPIEFRIDSLQGFNLDQGTRHLSVKAPIKPGSNQEFAGLARISFKIGETEVSYKRPLRFNSEYSHSNHFNLRRLRLKLRRAPRAYYQSQPLVIAGIPFDCMYPVERMMELQAPAEGVEVLPHEGDEVVVDLASENFICPWVYRMEFERPTQVKIHHPQTVQAVTGQLKGEREALHDFDTKTTCNLLPGEGKTVLEYDFAKPVTLNGLDASFRGSLFLRIWYQAGEQWVPLVWDHYSVGTGHHPIFPDTRSRRWRVEVLHSQPPTISTLRFYHNPNRIFDDPALAQSRERQFLPPLKPE